MKALIYKTTDDGKGTLTFTQLGKGLIELKIDDPQFATTVTLGGNFKEIADFLMEAYNSAQSKDV